MECGRPTTTTSTTVAPIKHYLYHPKILSKRLSPEQVSLISNPRFSCLCHRVYGSVSLSYTKLHSLFRMPVVYADSAQSEGDDVTPNVSDDSPVKDGDKSVSTAMLPSLQIVHAPIREVILDSMTSEMEVQNVLDNETGMDRLRAMFTKREANKDGDMYTQELGIVKKVMFNTMFLSFITLSFREAYEAKQRFVEQNRATVFPTKAFAIRRYNDYVIVQSVKTGFKSCIRLTSFATVFMLISQCYSVYRNKTSLREYSLAGGVTGALFKMNLGLKGMFSGGVFGTAFGFIAGVVISPMMKLSNETQEQRHYRDIKERLDSNRERPVINKGTAIDTEGTGQINAEAI